MSGKQLITADQLSRKKYIWKDKSCDLIFQIILRGYSPVLATTVTLLILGYSTGTLMKENAERQELAENYAKCTRRAKAANASLRSSRYMIIFWLNFILY